MDHYFEKRFGSRRQIGGLLVLFVTALALVGLVPSATAQFTIVTNNSAITITGYNGPGGTVVIPSATNGFPVTAIGPNAFANNITVTSVVVPNTVTSFGNSAFLGCQGMTGIILSTGLTSISNSVFQNCTSLTNIVIPNGVMNIGMQAFKSCFSLTNVTLPNSLIRMGDGAFDSCSSLPAIIIPNSATNLGVGLFVSCTSLRSVTLPNALSAIPLATFYFCTDLAGVNIPNSVTSINDAVFQNCTSLTNIVIPNGVTNIGFLAFNSCLTMTNFFIPSSVNTIAGGAFADCTNLIAIEVDPGNTFFKTVNGVLFNMGKTTLIQFPPHLAGTYSVPDGVTNCLYGAFQGCQLTTVTMPASILDIGPASFANSPQLATVYFLGDAPFENGSEFLGGDTNVVIYLNGSAGWGTSFGGAPTAVYVEPGFNYVDNNGAITITGYTGVSATATIPNTILGVPVVSIGENAFLNSPITDVIIPVNVTNLEAHAFASSALTHIVVPANVTTIGSFAFQNCTNLAQIYFNGNAPGPSDSSVFSGDSTVAYYLPGTTGWGSFFDGIPAVMLIPNAISPTRVGGIFSFNIVGPPETILVVEATTNLANLGWQPVSTNTLSSGGTSSFTDLQSPNFPRRFYRLRVP